MRSKRFGERPFMVTFVINVISPALIMGMILSLVWFLVFAFYQGNYSARLMYVLGLYTFATVLIARIAIDSGRAYAIMYLAAMGAAMMVFMVNFVTIQGDYVALSWIFNACLLGLIAYLADRIAFDCTMDDRGKQSLQEGLLQTLRLVERPTPAQVNNLDDDEIDLLDPDRPGPKKRIKHNSGVWVLYFAILAIPMFGLGQLVIRDNHARSIAFWFLFAYLGFALMLLICTSFLTIRRYLRDRGMEMPREIIVRWIGGGAIMTALMLLACILLPLPNRNFGVIELPFLLSSPDGLAASRYGWGKEGTKQATNAASQTTGESNDQAGSASAQSGDQSSSQSATDSDNTQESASSNEPESASSAAGDEGNSNSNSSSNKGQETDGSDAATSNPKKSAGQPTGKDANGAQEGKQTVGDQESSKSNSTQQNDQNTSSPPDNKRQSAPQETSDNTDQPDVSSSTENTRASNPTSQWNPVDALKEIASNLGSLVKWLTILVLVLFVLIYAVTHPREIAAILRDVWALFAMLFGWQKKQAAVTQIAVTPAIVVKTAPRFASFTNPFRSGERLTGTQVIRRSFSALEAWGAENGMSRAEDETPREFVAKLMRAYPQLGKSPVIAANMLDQVTFSSWRPKAADLAPLQQLWYAMNTLYTRAATKTNLPTG